MKEISLTQGKITLVSDIDYSYLNQFKWYAAKMGRGFYAVREVKGKRVSMHRAIAERMGLDIEGKDVDHKDTNSLNNQRENLRPATDAEQSRNTKPQANNKSGYKGVYRVFNRWRATIKSNNATMELGSYATPEEAAHAYDRAARYCFGEFAYTNFEGTESSPPHEIAKESSNRFKANKVSKYRGIVFHKTIFRRKRWQAHVKKNGKQISLGYYTTEEEAARAYNELAPKYIKNFIPNVIG